MDFPSNWNCAYDRRIGGYEKNSWKKIVICTLRIDEFVRK
jgi:hypothetical protein